MKTTIDTIQKNGLKKTPVRIAVLDILHRATSPMDADAISDRLAKHSIKADRVTVYRTLNTLVEYNILRKIEFHEGKFRYELSSLPHHHHLVCTNCGKVEDINECGMNEVEAKLQKRTSFKITQHNAEFFGLCKDCH